jgi:hypothetical protein
MPRITSAVMESPILSGQKYMNSMEASPCDERTDLLGELSARGGSRLKCLRDKIGDSFLCCAPDATALPVRDPSLHGDG